MFAAPCHKSVLDMLWFYMRLIFVLASGWPACTAPAGSLAAGTLAVNDILIGVCRWLPLCDKVITLTHAHARAERIFSVKHYSQTVMKHFICSGWAYDHAGVCVVMVTGTLFAETRGMLFSFGISGICRFLSLERRIGGIRAGCLVAILC